MLVVAGIVAPLVLPAAALRPRLLLALAGEVAGRWLFFVTRGSQKHGGSSSAGGPHEYQATDRASTTSQAEYAYARDTETGYTSAKTHPRKVGAHHLRLLLGRLRHEIGVTDDKAVAVASAANRIP